RLPIAASCGSGLPAARAHARSLLRAIGGEFPRAPPWLASAPQRPAAVPRRPRGAGLLPTSASPPAFAPPPAERACARGSPRDWLAGQDFARRYFAHHWAGLLAAADRPFEDRLSSSPPSWSLPFDLAVICPPTSGPTWMTCRIFRTCHPTCRRTF